MVLKLAAILVGLAVTTVAVAGPARAATPDDAHVALLAGRLTDEACVRVTATSGDERLGRVTLDVQGAWIAGPRPALVASGAATRSTLVRWDDIRSIDVGRPRGLEGATIGALIGAVLGAGAVGQFRSSVKEGDTSRAWIIAVPAIALGAAIGALTGHALPRWQQVYPNAMASRDAP